MGDEIGGGAGRPRPTIRTVLLVLVEAAAVVAGVVSLRRGVEPVQVRPPASPPVVAVPLHNDLGAVHFTTC